MKIPRIVIAAPRSGSGKTTVTISLMAALKNMVKNISAFKCGPDYIDPMFHKEILGIDSRNLDLFFTDRETTKDLFLKNNKSDISIVEGVMGLYDGMGGISEEASTYDLARTLKAPVVLVIDAKGMSRSILAEAAGFISMDSDKLIKGIILNNMSAGIYNGIKTLIEENLNVDVLGYFPKQKECNIGSRYLGLTLPQEVENLKAKINAATEEFCKTVDVDKIIALAQTAEEINSSFVFPAEKEKSARIAVAMDNAFNFYYKDNLELLENLGAELIYFSPLHDTALPENIDGLILGGGYPELFAKELSANKAMIHSIKTAVGNGLPVWAECGGFIYLHDKVVMDNAEYNFCGVINGTCTKTERLVRFGYITIDELKIKAHEFHYFESSCNGDLLRAEKPLSKKQWKWGHNINGGLQGFPHLYYPSNIEYAKQIIETCIKYRGI